MLCEISEKKSEDYAINRQRLPSLDTLKVTNLNYNDPFHADWSDNNSVIIDGIFGSGLSRPITGYWATLIDVISQSEGLKVAIDVPSGLYSDQMVEGQCFQADHTISFQSPKLSFFMPESGLSVGQWHIVPIGLSATYYDQEPSPYHWITPSSIQAIFRTREKFGHKGTYGHALLIAGSYGMLGAAILSARACLRSGAGLLSLYLPKIAYSIAQISIPEAMVQLDPDEYCFSEVPALHKYTTIGIGPGLGQNEKTNLALEDLLKSKPHQAMVFDADALNIISQNPDLIHHIPPNSILTPHPGEFKRLFGESRNAFEQLAVLRSVAQQHQVYIILKGAYSKIACPDGNLYFNSTGNPGMGTAGSGDVLTGILTGLLAQQYHPRAAAILGVYLHGLARDLSAEIKSQEALIASDIIEFLGLAYKRLISD